MAQRRTSQEAAEEPVNEPTPHDTEGLAHLAGDVLMPDVDAAAEWDTLEDFPTFEQGQWASVDGAGLLEIVAINQSAQGRLTVMNHGSEGNVAPGTVVYAGTAINLASAPPDQPTEDAPDFVWVGCTICWTPKDQRVPVVTYNAWLADGFRYLVYRCQGCGNEIHSSLWGFRLEDAEPYHEGGVAAEATEVKRWGS